MSNGNYGLGIERLKRVFPREFQGWRREKAAVVKTRKIEKET